ncbi:MAG: helix-turn-helix domain-containing protein [Deltaproteobacteria bacterium]
MRPVGSSPPSKSCCISSHATHAPLEAMVHARRFRDDLYYRLNGAHFSLPPLRLRADLGATIDRMLGERSLTAAARERLMTYAWPGNLRELKNVLNYAASMCEDPVIDLQDLPELAQVSDRPASAQHPAVQPAPTQAGAAALLQALRHAHWNVSEVARQLGLSRMTLYRRMKRAGIVAPNRE